MTESVKEFYKDLGLDPEKMPEEPIKGVGKIFDFESLLQEDDRMINIDITKDQTKEQLVELVQFDDNLMRVLREISKGFKVEDILIHKNVSVQTGNLSDQRAFYLKVLVKASLLTYDDTQRIIQKTLPWYADDGVISNVGFEVVPYNDVFKDVYGDYISIWDSINLSVPVFIPSITAPTHDLSVYSIDLQLLCLYELLEAHDGLNLSEEQETCYKKLEYFSMRFRADGIDGAAMTRHELLQMRDTLVALARSVGAMLDMNNTNN